MTPLSRRIAQIGMALLGGYLVLGVSAGYWHVARANGLLNDPAVSGDRQVAEADRVVRGRILDRNGVVLAETRPGPDGRPQRVYAHPAAVHTVGYYDVERGATGVEAAAGDRLAGRHTNTIEGAVKEFLHLPRQGEDVQITLDLELQQATEAAMADSIGAAVVLDPRNGDVLALVSNPTFDPSLDEAGWQALQARPDSPLLNRAIQGLYTPGSTFKTVTLAAALEARLVTPQAPAQCPANIEVLGIPVVNRNEPPGKRTRTVTDAYAYSCNTFFAQLGLDLHADRLVATSEAFGLTEAVPFALATERGSLESTPGYLDDDRGLAQAAFGQGELQLTPLHLALVAAAVANDGVIPRPRLFLDQPPAEWRRAISSESARALAGIMETSVQDGWASTGAIPGQRVAGKTGSAEVGQGEASHAVYIAFAPVDQPRVAVAVLKERAGAGSREAGPAVKAIIEAALNRPSP